LIEAIIPSFDESLPVLALAPVEPPCAPEEPPIEPDELPEPAGPEDEPPDDEPPDDELPMAPDEPLLDEPPDAPVPEDSDEPVDDEPDEPLRPPLLPAALEPPVEPALLVPPTAPLLEPVAGLALDDALPDRLPDEPALADEPLLPLPRLDCWSLPRLDWSLPMLLPLPCLLASTPFPSLDF
jgi:hypothetical protein